MHFNCPLGLSELRPGKDRKTQIDDRGIDRVQLVLKLEPVFRRQVLAASEKMIKKVLKYLKAPFVVASEKVLR